MREKERAGGLRERCSSRQSHSTHRRLNVIAFLLVLCLPTAILHAQTPAANPGRPTVTNPATLPPVGYLQFEQGYLGSLTSPETVSQYGVNQVTKIAVDSRLMLQVQTQPFATSRGTGETRTETASGDVLLGAQTVLFLPPSNNSVDAAASQPTSKSKKPTLALGYLGRVHAGSTPDIDQGGYAHSLVLLISGDVGAFHYDTNYMVNEQTADEPLAGSETTHPVRRAQLAQTLSVNHPLFNPNLQVSGEIYHFTQPLISNDDAGHSVQRANLVDLLLALSYSLRPNLVLDGGLSHGFTSTSTHWQSFAGFTYLLPQRLWRGKS